MLNQRYPRNVKHPWFTNRPNPLLGDRTMNLLICKTWGQAQIAREMLGLDKNAWMAEGANKAFVGNRFNRINRIILIKWKGFTQSVECWDHLIKYLRIRMAWQPHGPDVEITKYTYEITRNGFKKING